MEIPERLIQSLEAFARKREIENVEYRRRVLESKTDYIADNAQLCWQKDGLRFFLCETPIYREGLRVQKEKPDLYHKLDIWRTCGRFNGYVRFPSLPVAIPGFRDILTYVPVHGGITYFQDWWDGSVTYGFDTAHAVSMNMTEIINDVQWMMAETESMARGIQIAARFEPYYLRATTNKQKARVLDHMRRFLPVDPLDNMGIIMNLLSGEL